MERVQVACAMAQNFEQLRYHTQVCSNRMVEQISTQNWGDVVVGGLPWHFSRTPGEVLPPPIPGADTEAVLSKLAKKNIAPKEAMA